MSDLTVRKSNRQIQDAAVLAFATSENRAVLTLNRKHFIGLHRGNPRICQVN
jgi:hypothetical protein